MPRTARSAVVDDEGTVGSLVAFTDWSTLFVRREAFDGVDDGADLAQVFGASVALGEVLVQTRVATRAGALHRGSR